MVVVPVDLGLDELVPVDVVVQLHELVLALAVDGRPPSSLGGHVPEAFVGCLLGSREVVLFRSVVILLLPKPEVACYWKMGL